jgi:hypothetical protein
MQKIEELINKSVSSYLLRKPDFIILGAQKCGTSSLYYYLAQHPDVTPSFKKEIHFFDLNYEMGLQWYLNQLPKRYIWERRLKTGEATPYYLFHPHAPERIALDLPTVRLIVILRNPAERAISHYFHESRRNPRIETLALGEALAAEEERMVHETERMRSDPFYNSQIHQHCSYKSRGLYYNQLVKFDSYYRSGDLLVLSSEDFFDDPTEVMRSVFGFLNIDQEYACKDLNPRNIGSNRTEVPDQIYRQLEDFFAPHNQQLYSYLGRDFGW